MFWVAKSELLVIVIVFVILIMIEHLLNRLEHRLVRRQFLDVSLGGGQVGVAELIDDQVRLVVLQLLEDRGWVSSYWGASENNRKAKFYKLTPAGRKQLVTETSRWRQLVGAIGRVLGEAKG